MNRQDVVEILEEHAGNVWFAAAETLPLSVGIIRPLPDGNMDIRFRWPGGESIRPVIQDKRRIVCWRRDPLVKLLETAEDAEMKALAVSIRQRAISLQVLFADWHGERIDPCNCKMQTLEFALARFHLETRDIETTAYALRAAMNLAEMFERMRLNREGTHHE